MADDIVRRMELMDVPPGSYDEETLYDAVAEIERLRSALDAEGNDANLLMLEIERLRATGDALVAAIRNHDLREEHMNAWLEARRG